MKPAILIAAGAIAIAAIAAGVIHWQGQQRAASIATAALPALPDLAGKHPTLAARIQAADAAIRQGDAPVNSLQELSRLYHANGYYAEAWTAYAGLVQADPASPVWPYRLASILAGYGRLEEALPLYQLSLQLDSSYLPARIRIGDALLKSNDFPAAQAAYEAALAADPQNAYARVGLARVAIAANDWQKARTLLEAAIASTRFQIGADLLGDVYEKLGLPSKERVVLQNIKWGSFADIPDPRLLELMDDSYDAYQISIAGGWALHQGDIATGLKYIAKAVSLDPDNANLHYQIAGLHEQLGDSAKALQSYRRCIELQPDFADAWLRLIDHARQTGNANAARRLLDDALRASPNSPSLHNEKGDEFLAAKQTERAIFHYRRSIELRPNEASGYIRLARLYLSNDRIEEGLQQMRLALAQEPNNEVAASTLAFQAIMSGNRPEADSWLRRLAAMPRLSENSLADLHAQYQRRFATPAPN